MNQISFNEKFRKRTKDLTIAIFNYYKDMKKSDENRIVGKQLLRSVSSVAANFRAMCRGRSFAEKFSKMCTVVEEADETLFWLELLENIAPSSLRLQEIKKEATEILKVMSSYRSRMNKHRK